MQHATEKGLKVALVIDTPALGDTIAAIPTLRKISEAHDNKPITVFTSKPFLFEGHPLVDSAFPLDQVNKDKYFIHRTFMPLVGKTHNIAGEAIEFRYSNMDLRQFHAVSLGFTLKESEMEMDLYIERERELPVKDYVIIHPTHTWPTRTWEQAKWQELIDKLNERGIPVVAVGRDSAETGHFNTQKPVMPINIKLGVNLLNDPDNDPAELRWMMNHRARAVVTMDSGILHIAGTTDVNIIQLGSSIDNRLRAPYRNGSQDYKYQFVRGGCGIFCSSNQKYNIQAHGSIHGVPPQVNCLEGKPEFECHPTVDQVLQSVLDIKYKIDYDFIEIGTSDFHTLIEESDGTQLGLSIEPISKYLDALPNPVGVTKVNAALSDIDGTLKMYYIKDEDIFNNSLPNYIRGCNSADKPHQYAIKQIGEELYNKLVTIEDVPALSWNTLIETYNIGSIKYLKIDTEGHEFKILNSYFKLCKINPTLYADEILFEYNENSNSIEIEGMLNSIPNYEIIRMRDDVLLKKRQTMEKAYITHCNEEYIPIVQKMVQTVRRFSELPIIVYVLNSDIKIIGTNVITHRLDVDIREGNIWIEDDNDNKYVERQSPAVYDVITKKVNATIHALTNYANTVVYLDGDSIATPKIDELFDYNRTDLKHPIFTHGLQGYMMMNGKGNPFITGPNGEQQWETNINLTLEQPLCDLLNVDNSYRLKTLGYVQTGYFVANRNSLEFLKEWQDLCDSPIIKDKANYYAPFHEETIVNVLMWKYQYSERMPLCYINVNDPATIDEVYTKLEYNGDHRQYRHEWLVTPGHLDHIKVLHGEKRPEVVDELVNTITKYMKPNYKKTLLYLAPHLSTGGMPQFLVKRVESMLNAGEYNVHVLEYCQYSDTFLVQRNQIVDLLGKNFHTIAGLSTIDDAHRTRRMIELINEINPDLIHIEECPESFDSFNKLTQEGLDYLYNPDRPWKVIETCHNIWFQGENKAWNPDAYMFCTPYHVDHNFKDVVGSKWLATYPVVDLRPTDEEKLEAKLSLGFDPEKIHVLNVGLWTHGKNQAEGVNIAKIVESILPGKFQFHFVGNQASNFRDYWEPVMSDLPANVTIWHERANVADYMKAADAFMFNSTWECNPLALREAISYGLVTFSRNLEQYLDMFTPYIIPFTDDLNDNAAILLDRLTEQEKIVGDFIQPQGEFERFTEDLLEAYQNISTQGTPEPRKSQFNLEYQNGLKLNATHVGPGEWRAEFWDGPDLVYVANELKGGHWYGPSRKWHTDWLVNIYHNDEVYETLRWTLNGKEVLVQFDSSSLGDTLAWMGQMEPFMECHGIKKLLVRTHKNWLFDQEWYSQKGIELIYDWAQTAETQYNIGVYYDEAETWKRHEHKYDWRHITLAKIASDRLGIPYKETRPQLAPEYLTSAREPKKQIVIATQSTAQAKYWNNPTGWQSLVNHWNTEGYLVLHASKEGTELKGIIQLSESLVEVAKACLEAELFIGISSGLSWFAWALGVKTVIISGFTDPYVEFEEAIYVNNHQVCHGCWGNHTFDRGDWNWCPVWKGTGRQFECTKTITAEAVIKKIEDAE